MDSTQNTMSQGMGPPPLPPSRVRQSDRRDSTFASAHYPSLPRLSVRPNENGTQHDFAVTDERTNKVAVQFEDGTRLESATDDGYDYFRETFPDNHWLELKDANEDPPFLTLTPGQDRTDTNKVIRSTKDGEITNAEGFKKQVAQNADYWWKMMLDTTVNLRQATLGVNEHIGYYNYVQLKLNEAESALEEATNVGDRAQLINKNEEIEKLKTEILLLESDRDDAQDSAQSARARVRELTAQGKDLKKQIQDLQTVIQTRNDQPESGPTYAQLREQVNNLTAKHETEVAETDYWAAEAKAQAKRADEMEDTYASKLKASEERLHKEIDQALNNLTESRLENKNMLTRLLVHEPYYKPYTILRRDGRPIPEGLTTRHQSLRSGYQPITGGGRTSGLDNGEEPRGRRNTSRSRSNSRGRSSRPTPRTPAPTMGGSTFTFKLPELENFKGKEDEDYMRWKDLAIAKCRSYPEDWQGVDYLKFRVQGEAFEHIRDLKAKHFMDIIDALDAQYETYDREADAETELANGSLRQKPGQRFAEWRSKFQATMRVLKHKDHTQIRYAREFMRTGLAMAVTSGSVKGETINEFLLRAQHIDQGHQQIGLGKTTPASAARATTSSAPPARKPSGWKDSTPATTNHAAGHTYKKLAFERSEKDKKRLAELRLCFKCGKDGHQMRSDRAPCRGQPYTPSHKIPGLAALHIEELDNYNLAAAGLSDGHEEEEEVVSDSDLVDDEGYLYGDDADPLN
ncbi:hypothetical protein NX059_009015 [Plenodomus lindquistii]|nr:hypothetical protein NX059_009015 [Plenodomus lindquistii]